MAKLLSTNKTRPCPVCAKTNGNCRIGDDNKILCMTFPDGDAHPDWRYVKATQDGLWGIYYPATANDFDRDAWKRQKAEREEREQEIERQRREKCLPTDRRDAEYCRLFAELTLTDGDRQNLLNRGLSEAEIKAGGYVSIQRFQRLQGKYHVNLPGIGKYGNCLTNGEPGFIVPVRNAFGQIVAYQYRTKDAHKWSKNAKTLLGEQPMGVALPAAGVHQVNVIGTGEGFLKTQIAANRIGIPFIGAAGGNFTPKETKQALEDIQQLWEEKRNSEALSNVEKTTSEVNSKSSSPIFKKIHNLCASGQAPTNEANLQTGPYRQWKWLESLRELGLPAIKPLYSASNIFSIDCPDAGWKANPYVAKATYRRVKLIESLGYRVLIADWGQGWDKSVGDIDEISETAIAGIQLISPAVAFADVPIVKTTAEKFADWVAKQVQRIKPKGFGSPKIEGERFEGDRPSAWQTAINRGEAFLDRTLMGSGKSHTVPEITNPYGGKIWLVYLDHRNPTVEAIARDFTDLYPRNSKGFYKDANGKIKPADVEHPATITKGHCIRAELFPMLTELGHDPNDGGGQNPICATCPVANVCAHTPGRYRHDRRETLKSPFIRCHIDSMPRDWDYSKDIIICDEPSQLLTPTRKITTGWNDLLVEADKIRPHLEPKLWQELDAYLQILKPLFDAKGYGIGHAEIVEQLPTPTPALATAITDYHLDLTELFPPVEQETLADNLTPEERKKWAAGLKAFNADLRQQQRHETLDKLAHLPPKTLAHLITGHGVIRIQNRRLTLTLDNRESYAFLNRAASIGFLDATISGALLQTISGLERPIKVIHNTKPKALSNLTVNQITMPGIGSKQLSNTGVNRLQAVLQNFPNIPIIGLKTWAKYFHFNGHWWSHSRGLNDYAGILELLAIGLPNPNVGAIQDDYLALYGNLNGFEEHYARLVNEEILQLIGRQRANRYPDRQFILHLVTPENCDLSWLTEYGITVTTKTAFEINPAAGTATQFTRHQIIQAIIGGNHTQTAISKAIGLTQQAISKTLKAAGVTVETLAEMLAKFLPELATTSPYKSYTRGSCITPQLYKQFAWFFGLDMPAIAVDAIKTIAADGWHGFLELLANLPKPAQGKALAILYSLTSAIPPPPLIT